MIEEGEPAPDFTLPSDTGEQVTLSDFRGKPVVLYFYPRTTLRVIKTVSGNQRKRGERRYQRPRPRPQGGRHSHDRSTLSDQLRSRLA